MALADARDPVAAGRRRRRRARRTGADITIVCVDVPGCEHGAVLATADGGTVIFFSMATSFTAAALGAEGLAADVTMLIGNGYTRGHAAFALDLLRTEPGVRALFESRLAATDRRDVDHRLTSDGRHAAPRRARARARRPGAAPATAMLVVDGQVAWIGSDGAAAGARRLRRRGRATSTARWSRRRSSTPTCTTPPPG